MATRAIIEQETTEQPCPGKAGFCNQTVNTGEELCWHCEIEQYHPEGADDSAYSEDGDDWGR